MNLKKFASSRRTLALGKCLLAIAIVAGASAVEAALVHQYTFNDGTANDSIGGANGTAITANGGTVTFAGGTATLSGGGAGDSYIDLPDGMASSAGASGTSGSISTESWVNVKANSTWAVIYSFGNSGPDAEDNNGSDGDYWQVIPQSGSNTLRSAKHTSAGAETIADDTVSNTPLDTGSLQHVVSVIDGNLGIDFLYVNGALMGIGGLPAGFDVNTYGPVGDTQNWLGRSQWGDPGLDGSYDEFRVYDHALSPAEVAASFAAGPVPIPEPTTALLGLLGVGAALGLRRKRS